MSNDTIEKFEAMLAGGMDNPMLRMTLGNAYWKDKQLEPAIGHLKAAVEQKPDYSAAWKILGRAYADNEEHQLAVDAFDKGLECAAANGDKQSEKEITVFRKRAMKALSNG